MKLKLHPFPSFSFDKKIKLFEENIAFIKNINLPLTSDVFSREDNYINIYSIVKDEV